jgi:hypothetical protein
MKKNILFIMLMISVSLYGYGQQTNTGGTESLLAGQWSAENAVVTEQPNVHPLDLEFQRLSVRRFIFSNNINLSEFVPSEIVAFESMHPAFAVSGDNKPLCDTAFVPQLKNGKLILDASSDNSSACLYVGNVNPGHHEDPHCIFMALIRKNKIMPEI